MRIRAYLSVYGDEATVQAIHRETNIPHARIKQHTKVKAPWSATEKDTPWSWRTARVPIDIDNPDSGLKALLTTLKPIFPIIEKHQRPKTAVTLQMITQYEADEDPRGLHLSAATISLLSEVGAQFDNDVVRLMQDDDPVA